MDAPPDAAERAFARAVEDLYAAFADVPRPADLPGCPCCVLPDEGRPLLRRPLRDLEPDDLYLYAAKALNTWAGPEEFRYFAPRLLDLSADDAFLFPDPEIVFGKLAQAGWYDWPQRDAITAFLGAYWTRALAGPLAVETSLAALVVTGADMAPYLDEWGRLETARSLGHLHDFATRELMWRRGRPRLRNAFLDASTGSYRQVVDWLTGGPAAAAVGAAFARTDDEAALRLLAEIDSLISPG